MPPLVDARLQRPLITPEGVDLKLELADGGQRAGAFFLDVVFIVLALVVLTFTALAAGFGGLGDEQVGEIVVVIWLLGAFMLRSFYFTAFELSPTAATPGKKIMGLRVATRDGGRLSAEAVFTRNALRELEVFLPLSVAGAQGTSGGGGEGVALLLALVWVCIFAFMPLFNKDRLRCGDIVAGTWVVRTPKRELTEDVAAFGRTRQASYGFTDAQLAIYGISELHVLENVMRAADGPTMMAVSERIASKIAWDRAVYDPQEFLAAYYTSLRGRLEGNMRMGKRKKDKFDA